jgi:predicted Zn-dependent peptidase
MEQRITAKNGVDIYYYKQPNTHSICISLYVKSGVLYERGSAGITHFLEHLHFRKLGGRTQKELYYELESIGADLNAATYKEFMQFTLNASPKYFQRLTSIAAGLLGALEADAKDFTAEKRVVLSEIREDDQRNDVDFLSNKFIFKGTNLENPILGYLPSVTALTLDMLKEEKEKIFTKGNIFYYVTGNFSDDDILKLKEVIEKINMENRPSVKKDNIATVPDGFKNRSSFVRVSSRKFSMHDVKISFDVDFNKIGRRELIYLDSILSDGLCSLLREEMIEKKGLIYSFTSAIEQYSNIGIYYFNFSVYKSKICDTVKSFIYVLNKVKEGLSDMDLNTTRVFKTDNILEILDTPEELNNTFAYENHILGNNYKDIMELADCYRHITKEQLLDTARDIFTSDNVMLFSLGDKKGVSSLKLNKLLSQL